MGRRAVKIACLFQGSLPVMDVDQHTQPLLQEELWKIYGSPEQLLQLQGMQIPKADFKMSLKTHPVAFALKP